MAIYSVGRFAAAAAAARLSSGHVPLLTGLTGQTVLLTVPSRGHHGHGQRRLNPLMTFTEIKLTSGSQAILCEWSYEEPQGKPPDKNTRVDDFDDPWLGCENILDAV